MGQDNFTEKEQELIRQMIRQEAGSGLGRGRFVDFGQGQGPEEVSKYLNYHVPGTQPLQMFSDPFVLFDDREARKKKGVGYAWRNPNCKFTGALTRRCVQLGILREVNADEVDPMNPHAQFDTMRIPGKDRVRQQIRKDKLCLYEVAPEKWMQWGGEAYVYKYKQQMVELYGGQTDALRQQGYTVPTQDARFANGEALQEWDRKVIMGPREAIEDGV